MSKPHIRPERLAAYNAVMLTIQSEIEGSPLKTIGDIVEEALRLTDESCDKGRLSIDIDGFERDPDDD